MLRKKLGKDPVKTTTPTTTTATNNPIIPKTTTTSISIDKQKISQIFVQKQRNECKLIQVLKLNKNKQ